MSKNIPKKIKKKRVVKYPNKRYNYKRYDQSTWNFIDVFNEYETLKNDGDKKCIIKIVKKYNISRTTFLRRYNLWKNELLEEQEKRGGHNKIFTDEEEKELYEYITKVFIDCNIRFNDEQLQLLAIQKYNMLRKERDINYEIDEAFSLSNGWIYDFKKRWNLSSLKNKVNRKAIKVDPNELVIFLDECKKANDEIDKNFIFNLDETFWRICDTSGKLIGHTNSDSRKLDVNINPKSGFTVILIVSAVGKFLKPIIIIKGKTKRTLDKISNINNNHINKKYSGSGWINISIMTDILKHINKLTKGKPAVLILDKYAVHTDDLIQQSALQLNIQLIYVPAGKTATNQPLDVNINGPLKSLGKHFINKIITKDPFEKYTLENSINALIDSKNKISKKTIIDAFKIACNIGD